MSKAPWPLGSLLAWLRTPRAAFVRRRAPWFVVAFVLVALVALAYTRAAPTTWTATGYAEVDSGASSAGPGNALNAVQLASSYAYVIPSDRAILQRIARATGQRIDQVKASLDVYADTGSAELVLSYGMDSQDGALRGARALALGVASGVAGNAALAPGTVTVTALPTVARPASRLRPLAYGLLAALLFGLIVSLVGERMDPRIDDEQELEEVLGVPVTSTRDLTGSGLATVVSRWRAEGGWTRPLLLATVRRGEEHLAEALAVQFAHAGVATPMVARQSPEGGITSPFPGAYTVLVVRRGEAARAVIAASARLGLLDCQPRWTVLGEPAERGMREQASGETTGTEADKLFQFPTESPLSAHHLAHLFAGPGGGAGSTDVGGAGSADESAESER